jgi:hypothetical protein
MSGDTMIAEAISISMPNRDQASNLTTADRRVASFVAVSVIALALLVPNAWANYFLYVLLTVHAFILPSAVWCTSTSRLRLVRLQFVSWFGALGIFLHDKWLMHEHAFVIGTQATFPGWTQLRLPTLALVTSIVALSQTTIAAALLSQHCPQPSWLAPTASGLMLALLSWWNARVAAVNREY